MEGQSRAEVRRRAGRHIKRTETFPLFSLPMHLKIITIHILDVSRYSSPYQSLVSSRAHIQKPGATSQRIEEEDEVDETSVEASDIDSVMTQTGVSRSKAVKALKGHDGDIVSAIKELTT